MEKVKYLTPTVPTGAPPALDECWLLVKTFLQRGHAAGPATTKRAQKADIRQFLRVTQVFTVKVAGVTTERVLRLPPLVSN